MGVAGHLPAWQKNEADGTWQAWESWAQEMGRRRAHQVAQVRAASVPPPGPPEAYRHVPRRMRGLDGQIREGS